MSVYMVNNLHHGTLLSTTCRTEAGSATRVKEFSAWAFHACGFLGVRIIKNDRNGT